MNSKGKDFYQLIALTGSLNLIYKKMKRIKLIFSISFLCIISACGSNHENESVNNPGQTENMNASNAEADHMHDSINSSRHSELNRNSSENVTAGNRANAKGENRDSVNHTEARGQK